MPPADQRPLKRAEDLLSRRTFASGQDDGWAVVRSDRCNWKIGTTSGRYFFWGGTVASGGWVSTLPAIRRPYRDQILSARGANAPNTPAAAAGACAPDRRVPVTSSLSLPVGTLAALEFARPVPTTSLMRVVRDSSKKGISVTATARKKTFFPVPNEPAAKTSRRYCTGTGGRNTFGTGFASE